ncbi:flagellar protein FlaG [Oikeobacillus pervagus]|uniref:Flagellar protein FlaG n=1 Tax=Oikeobacillus pervagus TaxID=1325931 RepID=A0AAJ1SXZ5_9BACI|nr:flagellar protein FlaG [Oikeobacillus pervagus]MDQ0214913.1 flagellar protein FlaG [Oikeobacillus pervagus]
MLEKVSNPIHPLANVQVKKLEITAKMKEQIAEQQDLLQRAQSKEKVDKVINSMNEFLKPSNTHLKFEFHEKLQEYYVAIVDDQTNEVIKEIPPKKLLDLYASMTEYLGLLVDKKI